MYYLFSTPPTAHVQFSNAVGDMHFSDVFQKGENILTKSMDKVLVSQIRVRRDQDQRDRDETDTKVQVISRDLDILFQYLTNSS